MSSLGVYVKEAVEGALPDDYFEVDPNIKHPKAPTAYLFAAFSIEMLVCFYIRFSLLVIIILIA